MLMGLQATAAIPPIPTLTQGSTYLEPVQTLHAGGERANPQK